MYVDYNGDGMVTNDELKEGESILIYDGSNNQITQECFMKEAKRQPVQINEVQEQWKSQIRNFYYQNRTLNQQLAYGYEEFSFEHIEYSSDSYWQNAYKTIELGLQIQETAANATTDIELWNTLSQNIKIDLGLVYCDILGYYGQFIFQKSHDSEPTSDTNALFAYLDELIEYLPSNYKGAPQAISARAWLNQTDYQRAYQKCRELIDGGNYSLSSEDVFATTENKAVIWGGYNDTIPQLRKGSYFHPIRYVEVLLMAAEAANEIGQREEAIAYLNQIVLAKGQAIIAPQGATTDEIRGYIQKLFEQELNKEGLEYSTWRRWGIIETKLKNITGYKTHNSLLPVPKEALDKYPSLIKQNAGY